MPYSAGVFFLVMKLKPPKIIRHLFPSLIWEIDDPEGVFLTFDDGPTPGITEWILAMLEKYDAKATFFVLGKTWRLIPIFSAASWTRATRSVTIPTPTRKAGG